MTTCATCGSHLSRDYLRVCGDNDDTVRDCPHCQATRRAEARRSAAGGGDSSDAEAERNESKLVLTAGTDADGQDAEGAVRRSDRRGEGPGGSTAGERAGDGRNDGGRSPRRGVTDRGRRDDGAGSRRSVLSSVFDALR